MDKIYCKALDGKHISLFGLMKEYISDANPQTQFEDGSVQCYSLKNRSFDDMLIMAQTYYSGTTIEELVNVIAKLKDNKPLYPMVTYCHEVGRPVINAKEFVRDDLIKGIFTNKLLYDKAHSRWCKQELIDMIA